MVGLYALTLMEREGPVHGYGISERIAERTGGAWRPGPGAVYPSLKKLVRHACARPKRVGRRRLYAITPAGRALLSRLRSRSAGLGGMRPDLGALWAEVMGVEGVGGLLLLRLHRALEGIETTLSREPSLDRAERLRAHVLSDLSGALTRLRSGPAPSSAARRRRPGHAG